MAITMLGGQIAAEISNATAGAPFASGEDKGHTGPRLGIIERKK
jgi:hypothetical protein